MNQKIEITINGHLDQKWSGRFQNMEIFHRDKSTVIKGSPKDSASLYGIINQLRDLNLQLISIIPITKEY